MKSDADSPREKTLLAQAMAMAESPYALRMVSRDKVCERIELRRARVFLLCLAGVMLVCVGVAAVVMVLVLRA